MKDKVNRKNLWGLTRKAAQHDFNVLAEEYGRSVSYREFGSFWRRTSPGVAGNDRLGPTMSSIRAFFEQFENGSEMLTRLVAIENQRRKDKRVYSAYEDAA